MAACAISMASTTSSSDSSFSMPSTMVTVSLVPATVISTPQVTWVSRSGLMTNWPSTRPMRTPAIGPWNGASEIIKAADAPRMPNILGGQSGSADSTIATICTSSLYPLGNKGRMGRSIMRPVKMAASLGLPSRLKNPPGIFPAA